MRLIAALAAVRARFQAGLLRFGFHSCAQRHPDIAAAGLPWV